MTTPIFSTVLYNLPQLPQVYMDEGINSNFNYTESHGKTYACEAVSFSKTKFFSLLQEKFGETKARYLKNPPYSLYDWHTDRLRDCGIHWTVRTNPDASVWYRSNNRDKLFWDLEKAQYQDHYPSLFDTTAEHSVFNNSDQERIILSVTIYNGRPSYQTLLAFLQSLRIEEY